MPERWGAEPGGTLIAIGGHEDREGERRILRAVAEALDGGSLLIVATASRSPEKYVDMYREAFAGIGIDDVQWLAIRERGDAGDPAVLDAIAASAGAFFTGGSQARLLEAIRDTTAHRALRDLWRRGGVVAGTSAGASALGETAISGEEDMRFSPGLDFVPRVVIDQHFSQRDRLGRLRQGLSQTDEHVGIGIDEDTALVIRGEDAAVIGSGRVTLVAGSDEPRTFQVGDGLSLPARAPMR